MLELILLQNSCISSVSSFLSAPYTLWIPIAVAGVLMIIGILAIIYMVSPLIGRNDMREGIKLQIYETFFALALIIAFGFFSTWLCSFNPVPMLNGLNLVPTANIPSGSTTVTCQTATTLYELADCNLYQFTNVALSSVNYALFEFFIASSFGPKIGVTVNFIPGVVGLGLGGSIAFALLGPISSFMSYVMEAMTWLFLMNDFQLMIVSAAPLIFAIFLSIGLLSRIFGVTRSFGGSMIALGVGIGFVYPLLIVITYGFLNNAFGILESNIGLNAILSSNIGASVSNFLLGGVNSVVNVLYGEIDLFGFTMVGALFLPMINFIVVNTFVLDFSQAIGERMDFMSLLTRVI
ncbi:MAG: hypothetical protein ACP5RF_01900 [Candidatus Micrarchaeia archaeon]